jgi:hypothetical protein
LYYTDRHLFRQVTLHVATIPVCSLPVYAWKVRPAVAHRAHRVIAGVIVSRRSAVLECSLLSIDALTLDEASTVRSKSALNGFPHFLPSTCCCSGRSVSSCIKAVVRFRDSLSRRDYKPLQLSFFRDARMRTARVRRL